MPAIDELRDAFEKVYAERLRARVQTVEEALALRADRAVDLLHETFRELGKRRQQDVAPVRRGVGEVGWEMAWGKNMAPDYLRLSSTDPKEMFRLELVLEVSEHSLRPGAKPELAVEEAANDLAKLLWARAPMKVLAFGAHRDSKPASSIDALEAGLSGVIAARDKDGDYLLVAFPNLEGSGTVAPAKAVVWTKLMVHGQAQPPRERRLEELLKP
jgi:hypothetical protein